VRFISDGSAAVTTVTTEHRTLQNVCGPNSACHLYHASTMLDICKGVWPVPNRFRQ